MCAIVWRSFLNEKPAIEDKPRSIRTTTSVTYLNREGDDELIPGDNCVSVHNVADALYVSYGSFQGIIAKPWKTKPEFFPKRF